MVAQSVEEARMLFQGLRENESDDALDDRQGNSIENQSELARQEHEAFPRMVSTKEYPSGALHALL